MALNAEDQKRMYENLDWIVGELKADPDKIEAMMDTLQVITGLEIETVRHQQRVCALDPSTRDDANRVLVRWLRDRGRLPKRTR